MTKIKEIWKDIHALKGTHEVSNLGRIRSITRRVGPNKRLSIGRILKTYSGMDYEYLTTSNGTFVVHRLVAIAFIENTNNKPCVNHIDGDKCNNKISNLEWCTYSENERHSYDVLGKKPNIVDRAKGIESPSAKPLMMLTTDGILKQLFGSACEASRIIKNDRQSQAVISRCAKEHHRTIYGHIFRFITQEQYNTLKIGDKFNVQMIPIKGSRYKEYFIKEKQI